MNFFLSRRNKIVAGISYLFYDTLTITMISPMTLATLPHGNATINI